jgi:hypothetical protein
VDDKNHEQRPRASLRGKGREILLGQQSGEPPDTEETLPKTTPPDRAPDQAKGVDASSLSLTPEETEALLDFSPVSPAYEAALPLPTIETVPPAPVSEEPPVPAPEESPPAWWEEEPPGEALIDLDAGSPDWWPGTDDTSSEVDEEVEFAEMPADMESGEDFSAVAPPIDAAVGVHGAWPLAERSAEMIAQGDDLPYYAAPQVDALVPTEPEIWSEAMATASPVESVEPSVVFARLRRFAERATDEDEGGLVVPEGTGAERTAAPGIADPFEPVLQRQSSEVLFERTSRPDQELLKMLVDDSRIRKLARQIEALQEELAQNVYSDRGAADEYQKELLRASGLLMASRANYDDARAIVYRVRTDMNRQRKVQADIMRYRPLLLNYYIGWGIALVVLFLLRELFTGVTEAVGVGAFAALYYPMLFGIVGALISGYLTLERHTTRLRDFDPIHISWYLFNPLLGGVMGLLMFLLASIANGDLLQQTASEPERAITYLLCVVAGMNQNNVLRQLNDLLDRFGRGGKS